MLKIIPDVFLTIDQKLAKLNCTMKYHANGMTWIDYNDDSYSIGLMHMTDTQAIEFAQYLYYIKHLPKRDGKTGL